jgi:hypothetical protein
VGTLSGSVKGPNPQNPNNPGQPSASKVDPMDPETWALPDTIGPANVMTPRGGLKVPAGGYIKNNVPYYQLQNGDYSGAVISKRWGKDASWANAIARENPSEVWGGSGNTVHVGDTMRMPIHFLNPAAGSYGGVGGSTGGGSSSKPAMPTANPGPGREWVWANDEWVSLPINDDDHESPAPDDDDGDDGDGGGYADNDGDGVPDVDVDDLPPDEDEEDEDALEGPGETPALLGFLA